MNAVVMDGATIGENSIVRGGGVCEGQSGDACESLNSWRSGESVRELSAQEIRVEKAGRAGVSGTGGSL